MKSHVTLSCVQLSVCYIVVYVSILYSVHLCC